MDNPKGAKWMGVKGWPFEGHPGSKGHSDCEDRCEFGPQKKGHKSPQEVWVKVGPLAHLETQGMTGRRG